MAEQKDRDARERDASGTAAPLRSTRPPPATAADIDRVLGAIGGLSTQLREVRGAVETLSDRTQATEISLDELPADLGDILDAQDAQAQVVSDIRFLRRDLVPVVPQSGFRGQNRVLYGHIFHKVIVVLLTLTYSFMFGLLLRLRASVISF